MCILNHSPPRLGARLLCPPLWPETFINTGFFEEQIFVKHDPFCAAQIPAMVSNGTHCFKRQQGVFNYDITQAALRIDYVQAQTVVAPSVNETECVIPSANETVRTIY